jgi:hypothetical protein
LMRAWNCAWGLKFNSSPSHKKLLVDYMFPHDSNYDCTIKSAINWNCQNHSCFNLLRNKLWRLFFIAIKKNP